VRQALGKHFTIVVVAEGVKLRHELKQMGRGWLVGNTAGDAIGLFSGKEVRVSVLGHIQRGGLHPMTACWPRASELSPQT
jgi:6-phosphofructokinase